MGYGRNSRQKKVANWFSTGEIYWYQVDKQSKAQTQDYQLDTGAGNALTDSKLYISIFTVFTCDLLHLNLDFQIAAKTRIYVGSSSFVKCFYVFEIFFIIIIFV